MTNWTEEQYKAWMENKPAKPTLVPIQKKCPKMPKVKDPRPSKYNAKKTEVDGIIFASRKEANRYMELKTLEKAGLITDLDIQPKFLLQDTFCKNGKNYRAIYYVADYRYTDVETGKTVVEDCKGMKTDVYKLKKKLFEYKYPDLEIVEI